MSHSYRTARRPWKRPLNISAVSTFLSTMLAFARASRFLDSTEGDWEHVVAINQRSMFFCSQAAAPHLKKSRGRIVSLAS
ncbi:MAG: hypothetical protein DMG06_29650 [Acidobacteria bacterium]|nr:MAG: hypothetical protein DMG06_29650 [Acidobacteriota bacterium]